MQSLGERLRWARKQVKPELSARSLSSDAGCSESLVGQIERGTVKDPGASVLAAIARRIGCGLEWLITGAGEAFGDAEPDTLPGPAGPTSLTGS